MDSLLIYREGGRGGDSPSGYGKSIKDGWIGNGALKMWLLLSHFSRVWLCATPQTAAHQAPPSLGFSRQEHWRGCHFLLQCMKVKSQSEVTQSCPTLRNPMDCKPARLFHPWDFPGKNTRVGCHCLKMWISSLIPLCVHTTTLPWVSTV